jgi:hypothetical protein
MSTNITPTTTTTNVAIGDNTDDYDDDTDGADAAGDAGDEAWRGTSTNASEELREIPLDLFRNNKVKYPKDTAHLLETHLYYEVFSPSYYVEIRERTSEVIRNLQLKSWCVKYNEIRGTMQEGAKYAVDTRGNNVALKWGVTIGGQSPTGMRDVLEVLAGEEQWYGEKQLAVTRQFVYRLKFDKNEEEWMIASRNAKQEWMKKHKIQYENMVRVRARKSSFQKQMVVERANLNKKIERLELWMGEMVRHNKVNIKTLEFREELEEWNGKFGGAGKVVRLKMGLSIEQIRKALCTWNVKDNAICILMAQWEETRKNEEEEEQKEQDETANEADPNEEKEEEET